MRPTRSCSRLRRVLAATISAALTIPALLVLSPAARGQSPLNPFGTPAQAPSTPQGGPPAPTPPPAPAAAPVIARVEGRDITQADFDRLAQPYFQRLKSELGAGFQGEVRTIATFNVLDELVRRHLLAVEAGRQRIEVTQADIDAALRQDPFFLTNGKFDPTKFEAYKSSPASNYMQVLPRLREVVATAKLDEMLRRRFTPTPAQVQAEWAKRTEQVRFQLLPLLTRDMPLDGEADSADCVRYWQAHPDEFTRRTRVRLRYARLPLPAAGDTTRAAGQAQALARAGGIADSLRRRTLPDTAAELVDTGLFDVPGAGIPGLGRIPELADTVGRAAEDSTIRVVGPVVTPDAVVVGVLAERQAKHLPPLREVLGDVKRRADAEKRRVTGEADRRAYWEAHRERWRGPRASLTRATLAASAIVDRPPTPEEVERWYAQHGRTLFGLPDSSRAWQPTLSDSLRTVVQLRLTAERRAQAWADALGRLAAALRSTLDVRAAARAEGAAAETLALAKFAGTDTLFNPTFVESLVTAAPAGVGTVHGPRFFGSHAVVWRIDAVDTSFVPAYELVRARSDQAFAEERRQKDEADARAWFEQHRGDFRTPVKYGLDLVSVRIPPPDSVHVLETAIRRQYDGNRTAYRQEEQVKARHILFMTRGLGPEQDKVAKARADSLLAAIRTNGGDFAELAKRFSQEPGAATGGGDLGWFGRGRMVKEFETAAFALEPGGISPVVKTQFGYHIIKVEDRRAAGVKPYADVRTEIRTQLAQASGDSTARRAAEALRRRLALGGDAKALAAPRGGVVSTPPLAAGEPLPGIGFAQALGPDLPGMKPGRWGPKAYRAGNAYVLVRVREVAPPRPAEFDEVKAQAAEDMKNAKRRELLQQKVAAIRTGLAAGAAIDSLAAPYGGLKDTGLLGAQAAFVPGVGNEPRLVQKALALAPGQLTDTLQVSQGVVWLRGGEKKAADPAEFKAASPQLIAEWIKKQYDAWVEEKKRTVKIEILRPDLRGPRPATFRSATTGG